MISKAVLSLLLALCAGTLATRSTGCRAEPGASGAEEVTVLGTEEVAYAATRSEPAAAPLDPPAAQEPEPEEELDQAELERLTAAIQKDIEELRGVAFLRPVRVSVTDLQGLQSYMKQKLEEEESPEDIRNEETTAKLLGLMDPDGDLLGVTMAVLEEQVGGFYEPSEETFYLMSRFTGGIAKTILAHELTHALDDQLYDLDGWLDRLDDNADAQLAFRAVAEGSGTVAMNAWVRGHLSQLSLKELAEAPGMESPSLADAPPFVWKPLVGAYLRGASFLVRSDRVIDGQGKFPAKEDVERVFTQPPQSSEQILHPEKYWDEASFDPPRTLAFTEPELPEGWSVLTEETLGEMGLALLTWPLDDRGGLETNNPFAILKIRYTNAAAEGWGGDRLALVGRGDARLLHLVTVWDAPEEAREFESAVRELEPHLRSAAQTLATRLGLEGSGLELGSPAPDRVELSVWAGVGDEEAGRLIAGLRADELPAEPVR